MLLNDEDENVALVPLETSDNQGEVSENDGMVVNLSLVEDPNERKRLLDTSHALGHFAARQIVHKVHHQGYYWPKMLQDAMEVVDKCSTCQKYQLKRQGFHPLKHFSATYPFEWLVEDHYGPLRLLRLENKILGIQSLYE